MNKQDLVNFAKMVQKKTSKHSPAILTGIGIAGMLTTTVLAVKATPKALELIEAKKKEEATDKLTPIETVKATWKCYIPAAVSGISSAACLIGANSVNTRRMAALTTAYQISETAFSEYREKMVNVIGEKKEKTVRDKIHKDKVEQNPVTKTEIIVTDKGSSQCYDPLSGRYFKSDIEKIRRAENDLNKSMIHDFFGYISLNEFYDAIGLPRTELGDVLGWNLDKGSIDIYFGSQIADNGEPTIVIDHVNPPIYDFDKR